MMTRVGLKLYVALCFVPLGTMYKIGPMVLKVNGLK